MYMDCRILLISQCQFILMALTENEGPSALKVDSYLPLSSFESKQALITAARCDNMHIRHQEANNYMVGKASVVLVRSRDYLK